MHLFGLENSDNYYSSGLVYFVSPISPIPPLPSIPSILLTRSADLPQLHHDEWITIQQTVANSPWRELHCATNVANLLELLPYIIANKLKVVLSTHELKPLRYYGSDYKFHVFLLGNTEDGLIIFDVASTYGVNNDAGNWLRRALDKEDLRYCFFNDRFLRWLPQFRFMNGEAYRLFYREGLQIDSSLLTPNLAVKHQDVQCFSYQLWNDSFFLNMHETWQLFSGQKTYGESVALHVDGLVSPKDRLSDHCIRELKEALELSDSTPESTKSTIPPLRDLQSLQAVTQLV